MNYQPHKEDQADMAQRVTKLKSSYRTYQKMIFSYGILAVLYALEHYEKIENYEECQKIIDAIRNKEKELGIKLFTTINKESLAEVKSMFKGVKITEREIIEASKQYSKIIIKQIEKQNK